MSYSIAWALFALLLLIIGIRKAAKTVRYASLGLLGAVLVACASGGPPRSGPGGGPPPGDGPASIRRGDLAAQTDMIKLMQGLGLLANGLPMPFSGSIASAPGPKPDTSLVIVSLSMPTQAFAFIRENDRFRASYVVAVEARQGGTVVARSESNETVRVVSFKETQRMDESVLFQQQLLLPPGTYTVSVLVRDGSTSRSGTQEREVVVPRRKKTHLKAGSGASRR